MDRDQVTRWLAAYEAAWRAPGTQALAGIFTADATYRPSPYKEAIRGLAAIARMWEAERDGPGEVFEISTEVVAVENDTAVVRAEVRYGQPVTQEWRDLWVVRFGPDGRCASYEEWPFAPARTGTPG
jgi:ketosteroid isomerase-like protein